MHTIMWPSCMLVKPCTSTSTSRSAPGRWCRTAWSRPSPGEGGITTPRSRAGVSTCMSLSRHGFHEGSTRAHEGTTRAPGGRRASRAEEGTMRAPRGHQRKDKTCMGKQQHPWATSPGRGGHSLALRRTPRAWVKHPGPGSNTQGLGHTPWAWGHTARAGANKKCLGTQSRARGLVWAMGA